MAAMTVNAVTGQVTLGTLHERTLDKLDRAERSARLRLQDAPYQSEADRARADLEVIRHLITLEIEYAR